MSLRRVVLRSSLILAFVTVGCAGPTYMRRSLDRAYNQMYVDNPVGSALAAPFFEAGMLAAGAVDYTLVNPVFWWKDAMKGQGTPYYYTNPTVPEEQSSDEESDGGESDKGE